MLPPSKLVDENVSRMLYPGVCVCTRQSEV